MCSILRATMRLQLVLLLCFVALCAGKPSQPGMSCPKEICVCSDSYGSISPHHPRQQTFQAICKEMPRHKLSSNIKILRVSGSMSKITKSMIRILGGELLTLDLSNCAIDNIEPGSFDSLPKLHSLKLSNNHLLEPPAFFANRMMNKLFLDGNKLRNVDSAFSKFNQLRELHLERNFLTKFPSKLPISLEMLNISYNNIGPTLESDMYETNLKTLDLCGNRVTELSPTIIQALHKLENLCVGNDAVNLPSNTATSWPHIASLSLVGPADQHPEIDSDTETELHGMSTLTSLSIVHYTLNSLTCLQGLPNLRHLELKDISAPPDIEVENIMRSLTSLTWMSIEGSQNLAEGLLYKMHVLGELHKLKKLSLRRTNITYLPELDVPQTDDFQLDISENPLVCDCKFRWLLEKKQTKGAPHFLLNVANTVCTEPQQFHGKQIMEAISSLDCSSMQEETTTASNVDLPNVITDASMLGGGNEQPETGDVFTPFPGKGEDNVGVDSEQAPEGGAGDQNVQVVETTPDDSDLFIAESMPIGDNDHKTGDYSVLYIILGCLLAILILVGIALAIFYWHFKRTGSNKVTPEATQPPAEQSFQQLQQTEESGLVKDVKKYSQE